MAKQLMLEGFIIKPVGHIIDVENSIIEPIPLGEQKVKLADLHTFADDEWPKIWKSLQEQFKAQMDDEEARALGRALADESTRSVRRAAARKTSQRALKAVAEKQPK